MSDNLAESVKQVLEERIKSPLWGFIILAWLWFNWPNLAMLFMSDDPVKVRIDYIRSQEFFYLHFVVVPFFVGGLLAIVTPYAQWLLSKAHKWANDRSRENVFQSKEQDYKDDIELSKLKVQSSMATTVEKARIDAELQSQIELVKQEALKTEEMEVMRKELIKEVENLRESVFSGQETIKNIKNEKDRLQDLIFQSLGIIGKFFRVDNANSIQSLKSEIGQLFSVEDFENSTIRVALKEGKDLTDDQISKLFNSIGSIPLENSRDKS